MQLVSQIGGDKPRDYQEHLHRRWATAAKNLEAALAPEFEWTEAGGFPYGGAYYSLEEVEQNHRSR